jgi:hypothetical protein
MYHHQLSSLDTHHNKEGSRRRVGSDVTERAIKIY